MVSIDQATNREVAIIRWWPMFRGMTTRPRPAPRNWRRRMGTAVLFLLALDALILVGPYSQTRLVIAVTISLMVALSICLIWRRNTRLEGLTRDRDSA